WQKAMFTIGALAAALAFAALAVASAPAAFISLALTIGTATAAVNTLAYLFVVEKYPRAEWDDRVSWLQGCYNTGMLGGMLLAGAVAEGPLRLGLVAAGALAAGATLLGWATVPALPRSPPRGAGGRSPTGPGPPR